MADTRVLPEYAADAHASSHGPDQCDTHGAVRHGLANGGAAVCYSAFTCLRSLGVPCSQGRCVPALEVGTPHPPGPPAVWAPARQRSSGANIRPRLTVPKLQQHGLIPVRAASLNYREVDLPIVHLSELDSMDREVMCHATHSIDSSLLSNRGITVTRPRSSIRHAHKAGCYHRRHRRDTRANARRTAERSNIFGRITSSQLQLLEHTGPQLPVSGAPTLTRSKLLLIGMKLLRRQSGRRQLSGKKLPQIREGRDGLRLRTAPPPTGPAASSHQRCFQRPHTYRH